MDLSAAIELLPPVLLFGAVVYGLMVNLRIVEHRWKRAGVAFLTAWVLAMVVAAVGWMPSPLGDRPWLWIGTIATVCAVAVGLAAQFVSSTRE